MNRKITCKNEDDVEIIFTSDFSPLLLMDADGLYDVQNNVTTSANTMINGSTYQGSVQKERNIVLTVASKSDHQGNRELLRRCFKSGSKGTLTYEEGTEKRQIGYYVESIDPDSRERVRQATISLICPDPFFEDLTDTTKVMAGWVGGWTFPHKFQKEGEPFAKRQTEKLLVIENYSAADNIGLTFTLKAVGDVSNPSLKHVENQQTISIGSESNPFSMEAGDILTITTGTNNKHVYFTHDGDTEEINEYLTEDSEFIQLSRGTNTLGFSADAGEDYITVTVSYRLRYSGA